MQHRGTTPLGGVSADDLRPRFEDSADAVSSAVTVLLATNPAEENAGPRWAQRWKTARRELESMGAEAAALERLDDASADAYRHGDCFYAVADASRLWVAESWPGAPRQELLRVATLPSLAPLLARRQRQVPHVVALVDREGADIITVERGGEVRDAEVEGEHGAVIRKTSPGGWSQRRYQDRAEESWNRTARGIADAIVASTDHVDAQVVVLAGDVREVQLVREALPAHIAERTHVVHGGRAAGTDDAARAHEVERLLDTAVADATVALLRKLREELGQHDRAVVGTRQTFTALQKAQVEVLLVHDDPADERTAWFGDTPTAVGATGGDLEPADLGVDPGAERVGRLVDVAIWAAIGTGADVRVVPSVHALPDGLGAILRWSDSG
jgi:peptide subunit release factor 1 (eRF1)